MRAEQGTTVVMVSHDLSLAAMYADVVLLLKGGTVLHSGTPREVLTPLNLKNTYECSLLVDENPVVDAPRVTLIPQSLSGRPL